MCTLLVIRNQYPSYPVVVAANRDELLDRASEPPAVWDRAGILAPIDRQRGGTWIGVNADGVLAALTNRNDVKSVRGRESRGELVVMALRHRTAEAALQAIDRLDPRRYNGFHLVIVDAQDGYLAIGDGVAGGNKVRVSYLADGLHVITNLGVGLTGNPRNENIVSLWEFRKLANDEAPHYATFDEILTYHDRRQPSSEALTKSMASVCIHRPDEENYGTKSSAFIRLRAAWGGMPAAWLYRHRERTRDARTGDDLPNCRMRWQPERRLEISSE